MAILTIEADGAVDEARVLEGEPQSLRLAGVTQKFDMPLMLSPAGRLASLKKPGWPRVDPR